MFAMFMVGLCAEYLILGLIPTEVQVHHGRHAFWLFPQDIQQNGMAFLTDNS